MKLKLLFLTTSISVLALSPFIQVFAIGLPFGTPRVISHPIYCLNGGVMVAIQPTIPPANPPGLYFVPIGSNKYSMKIYPPFTGVKMLGSYIPGGACVIPALPSPIPIPTIGTVIEYGSAYGF
ncbi:MAG: hypothetical protein KatS3mg094_335 [Candidatus Parcubacteria bacterium]|nr:MAG: hypothetical protein KatS3mg094_335 [Candidatus Parcubacteria bacterium]